MFIEQRAAPYLIVSGAVFITAGLYLGGPVIFYMYDGEPMQSRLYLFLRSALWSVIMPGTVAVYIPYKIVTVWSPSGVAYSPALLIPAIILLIAGISILLSSIWNFATVGRGTLSPIDAPRRLVITGFYRYVRNPMYIGVLAIVLGESLLFGSAVLAGYAAGLFLVFNLFIMLYEEPALRKRFGEPYRRYCESVGRWLPGRPYRREESEV